MSDINLEGLLLTKQTFREKDVSDRIVIEPALEVMQTSRHTADSQYSGWPAAVHSQEPIPLSPNGTAARVESSPACGELST